MEADVDPDALLRLLANPARIPEWAPAFADTVKPDTPTRWLVTKGRVTFALDLVVALATRTVDYLREIAPGRVGGAYIRVVPRPGGGSVIIMTLAVSPGSAAGSVGAVLDQELHALVNLSEAGISTQRA